ncbi:hypothetical protein SDRG_13956 [Saprolegnia diclina VS20]|uniref:Uncharacterized protein n=1 Tax=Saprolegnia diclina (strain VS20) TaxID=1156394 RepID=T0Q4B3_SAPDV|nr:hypothetical protein SDRG_13956 [Saprolegnia diclina VS20]EQC28275.1 hypothetical protein SDRG_13956 [Saprolegnia diclina VS20]|eukprot:XP_008618279.1 hypothetical protein SDRG_13956 [Saprolegnia diclina VS20]
MQWTLAFALCAVAMVHAIDAAPHTLQGSPVLSDATTLTSAGNSSLSVSGSAGAIALDLQTIAANGLSLANAASLLNSVQSAIDSGILDVKDPAALISSIRDVLQSPSTSDGAAIVDAIVALLRAAVQVDPNPKVCRRQAIGRGIGSPAATQCLTDEDKYGALCYPKCKEGYEAFGCCICRKKGCGGADCAKDSYGRGVGVSRLVCPANLEKSGLFCYPPCAPRQTGVGAFCFPDCVSPTSADCGLFCTSTVATCVSTTVDILGSSAKITLALVTQDYIGAITSLIQVGGKYLSLDKCPK